jgi:hypothetical protein
MQLLQGDDLPQRLKIDRQSSQDERRLYNLCGGKLLTRTWNELEQRDLIRLRCRNDAADYAAHTYLGLTIMAILARCCAGSVKHTITDQDDSYFTMLKHLEYLSGDDKEGRNQLDVDSRFVFKRWLDVLDIRHAQTEDDARQTLISITLDVVNAASLPVRRLVELRTERASFAAQLRENFAKAVEDYVQQLTAPGLFASDAAALQDEFRSSMQADMDRLRAELRFVALKTVLSKEVAVAITAPLAGSAVLTASGLGSVLGGTLGAAALIKVGAEYRAARNSVLEKHPMAFLYAQKGVRLY